MKKVYRLGLAWWLFRWFLSLFGSWNAFFGLCLKTEFCSNMEVWVFNATKGLLATSISYVLTWFFFTSMSE